MIKGAMWLYGWLKVWLVDLDFLKYRFLRSGEATKSGNTDTKRKEKYK